MYQFTIENNYTAQKVKFYRINLHFTRTETWMIKLKILTKSIYTHLQKICVHTLIYIL